MKAEDIIRQVGALNLSDYTGECPCGSFSIRGLEVRFHCWRTCKDCEFSGVHVKRIHDDCAEDLASIGSVVLKELKDHWPQTDWVLVCEV